MRMLYNTYVGYDDDETLLLHPTLHIFISLIVGQGSNTASAIVPPQPLPFYINKLIHIRQSGDHPTLL